MTDRWADALKDAGRDIESRVQTEESLSALSVAARGVARRKFVRYGGRVGLLALLIVVGLQVVPREGRLEQTSEPPRILRVPVQTSSFQCGDTPTRTEGVGGVELSLDVSTDRVAGTNRVRITPSVKNTTPTTLIFTSSPSRREFWAQRDGRVVWTWRDYFKANGGDFTLPIEDRILQPEETYSAPATAWNGTGCDGHRLDDGLVPPGEYQMFGSWSFQIDEGKEIVLWSDPVRVLVE
ncbi:MAG TPA: hypothetical protein VGB64_14315 [Actinomycetota bacterium]